MSGEVYVLWLMSLLQTLSAYGADLSSEACRELGAASRRPRWKRASSTLGPSWRCVDENWGGSPKSKLLSGVTSPRCSRVFRSSTSEARILVEEFLSEKLEQI
ncbi:Selenoprotein F [Dissostichus eleginoides]|uniref:Selenoprotein F n=1 Tax=Dissostichus eleginoides TaxID=100907 RepID=A0AAD9EUZ6_DISEL|nr:Selenoprotein F [Dissostichus eleginoides]